MPLNEPGTDLMVLDQGGTTYKVSTETLRTFFQKGTTVPVATNSTVGTIKPGANVSVDTDGVLSASLPSALVYKGTVDLTAAPTGDALLAKNGGLTTTGHTFINTVAGVSLGWNPTIPDGTPVIVGEMVLWDGAQWDIIGLEPGVAGGVQKVTGTAPVEVGGSAADPVVSIKPAVAAGSTNATAGTISAAQLQKLDDIAVAQSNAVTDVTGTGAIDVTTGNTPAVSVKDATTDQKGAVQLAKPSDVTIGTPLLVVTADQLAATNTLVASNTAAIATAASGGITSVLPGAPPNGLSAVVNAGVATVTMAGATEGLIGTVKLATLAETTPISLDKNVEAQIADTSPGAAPGATISNGANGVADPRTGPLLGTLAVTPASAELSYLPKDFGRLTLLP